jgi:hypothetical protein
MNTHGMHIQNDPDDAVKKSRFQKITNTLGAVGKKVNSFGRHVVGTVQHNFEAVKRAANEKLAHGNLKGYLHNVKNKTKVNKKTTSIEAAALADWKEPSFLNYDECKNPKNTNNWVKRCKNVHGKRISANSQMLNFRREVKNPQNEGTAINYESRKKRYWRSTNYHEANDKHSGPYVIDSDGTIIPIRGSTKVFYTAKAPRLHGSESLEMRYHNTINSNTKDGVTSISLEKYQKMLEDPATRAQANAELAIFKQMLIDARTMKRDALEAKYNQLKTVESIASTLGMIFGTAAGSGVSSAVTTGIGYASQAVSAASLVAEGHAARKATSLAKTTLGVAGKVAASVVIGTVLGVSGAGFPLAVLAVVSTAATVGARVAEKQVAKKMLTAELDADKLVHTIDEMIKKDGVIEENNPMFANARRVKNVLNAAKSRGENVNSVINSMTNTNKKLARNLLKQMEEPNTGAQKQAPTSMFGGKKTRKRKRT